MVLAPLEVNSLVKIQANLKYLRETCLKDSPMPINNSSLLVFLQPKSTITSFHPQRLMLLLFGYTSKLDQVGLHVKQLSLLYQNDHLSHTP